MNPNIPWKTRGNAAIALRFHDDADLDQALSAVLAIVERAVHHHDTTSPGVVVAREAPPASLYEAAVTRVVERSEVDALLAKIDARAWGGRGVIGASSALAWPAHRSTYERIAYRAPERAGTRRDVDDAWAREIEWTYPTTFDSYDLANGEVVCVPSGPDPVLWGIRGSDPADLERASAVLGPERPARETLFLTNQGTDDHLVDRRVAECAEYLSARVRGRVQARPSDQHGSVFFEVADDTGALRCAAYPPTRELRYTARALDLGDEITVCGGLHAGPDGRLTLGIEKMHVHATSPRHAGAPVCDVCSRTMESAGHEAGYRCRTCHTRADAPRMADSIVRPGWVEAAASARRHLAMP
ncbi:MAG TPA: tRNA(Ile)(2)-agmatinylcytidine synthase, partial [Candidatus Thermoplasmatota archaeon]|nr:tRNA(Ile)(2)-agmatinylcytidine synthase [Candidatus Thermoplasmatota archaeon]